MARVRRAGGPPGGEGPPPTQGPSSSALFALLSARRFRLGPGSDRVAENLHAFGGEVASDAAALIGYARPPADSPSVALGPHPGTLGPRSFGFLNVRGQIAALDGPVPAMPRQGRLGIVIPGREALPDIVPLCLDRALGVSFIVSVGDGDPAETLRFLAQERHTEVLAVVLGAGQNPASLRAVLGAKPSVVLGAEGMCRAVARRAGAHVVDRLDDWLALAALLDAGVELGGRARVIVAGGGKALVAAEIAAAGLSAELVAVDDERDQAALEAAVTVDMPVVVVAGSGILPLLPNARVLRCDLRHPEALRTLFRALAAPLPDLQPPHFEVSEPSLRDKVRAEIEDLIGAELGDHDLKRLLKSWSVRVTRQAPTNTPTGAQNLARTIGLPVLLVGGGETRVAESMPEVRQLATLLLQKQTELPSVLVRERFPDAPRAKVRVTSERGLGLMITVEEQGQRADSTLDAAAMVPLTEEDALRLAAAAGARRAGPERAVADLLLRVAAVADGERLHLELEVYVGAEPSVIEAKGTALKV